KRSCGKLIIRCDILVYQCQKTTPTNRLWNTLKRLPIRSLSAARNFWNQKNSSSSCAKQKRELSPSLKPTSQQPVKQTGEVGLTLLGAFYILFCKRDGVRILAHWLSASASPFPASLPLCHLKKYVSFIERLYTYVFKYQETMANKRMFKEKQA